MNSRWKKTLLLAGVFLLSTETNAQSSRYYLPQIANGAYSGGTYRTTFVLSNNNDNEVSATIGLTDDAGRLLPVTIPGLGTNSQFTLTLSAGSSRIIQTDGSGNLTAGAAVVDTSAPIGVSSIFTLYDTSGAYQTEAGVGSSELLSDFVFPVDATGSFNTGVALFNGSSGTANINLALIGTNGEQVQTATRTLASYGHLATFVAGPGALFASISNFRGTLLVQSSLPVAALVLRQNPEPLSYTSLPVVPRSTNRTSLNLAHVATGDFGNGYFRTSFLILNPSAATADGTLTLTRDDGSPLVVAIQGRPPGSSFSFSLAAGASVFLETDGLGPLAVGAAVITSNTPVGASAIFTVFDSLGKFKTEAGVADSEGLTRSTLPVDVGGGADTGVAFFNPGTGTITLTLRLLDASGAVSTSDVSLNLPPKNHIAAFVSNLFPGRARFQGVLTVSATAPVAALTLRQNAGPSYTTLPVTPGLAAGIAGSVPTAGGTGNALSLTLAAGAYWDYAWSSESSNFVQGSGTTTEQASGRFRVTLGAPVNTGGLTAFPVTVTGASSDGATDFAPDWKYVAISSNGSFVGSIDGAAFSEVFNAGSTGWNGGGFFVAVPATQAVSTSSATFPGQYNQFSSTRVGRQASSGGCTYFSDVGTVCSGDPTNVTEYEYFKSGFGPVGYKFTSSRTFSGGGFTTSSSRTRLAELVATSLTASDGTVLKGPPWEEVKSMNTARYRHAAVVLSGKIYVIGGFSAANAALASVEIYDLATDTWSAGTPMTGGLSGHTAEVVAGKIYVIPSTNAPVRIFDPATNSWTTGALTLHNDPALGSCPMLGDYVLVATPNGALTGNLQTPFYQASTNRWSTGFSYTTSDRRWFSVACIDDDLYLAGGYRQFLTTKVDDSLLRYHAVTPAAWTASYPRMSQARYDASAVAFNGEFVMMGGRTETLTFRTVEAYKPGATAWRTLPSMLRARTQFDSVVLGGAIYVIGGRNGSDTLAQVERYKP